MSKIQILFGTSNLHKVAEAKAILEPYGFIIKQYKVDLLEIQDSNLDKIAKISIENLSDIKGPLFVEDTGLFIEALNGFPGPFASYVFKTIGNYGILQLMNNLENKKAYFESYIAYKDESGSIHSFHGKCNGEISNKIKGSEWGYDPIFIPNDQNPDKLTFAEMTEEQKNHISHRSLALESFKNFLTIR